MPGWKSVASAARTSIAPAVVSNQAEADLPSGNVDHPSPIAVARVLLSRDRVILILLGIPETDADGERLLGIRLGTLGESVGLPPSRIPSARRDRPRIHPRRLPAAAPLSPASARGATVGRAPAACVSRLFHLAPHRRQARVLLFPRAAIRGARHQQNGRRVRDVPVHHLLRRIAEEGAQRVKILLRDRVELVIVARRAAHRHTEPDRAHRVRAILRVDFGVLVIDDPDFVRGHVASLETGGDPLLHRRVGEQIAGQLFDRELVEREIAIVGRDHPIAIRPDLAIIVDVDPVRVAVARGVQPVACAVFAVMRRGQVAIHHALVSIRGTVLQEGFDFGGLGRQSGGIQGDAADQCPAIFGRSRREALLLKPRENETVDRVAHPRGVLHGRRRGLDWRLEGPVLLPWRAAVDPAFEQRDLRRSQPLVRLGRWHPRSRVRIADALVQQAVGSLAGYNRRAVGSPLQRRILAVQPKSSLPRSAIRPVALEAVVGKNRADLPLEIRRRHALRGHQPRRAEHEDNPKLPKRCRFVFSAVRPRSLRLRVEH